MANMMKRNGPLFGTAMKFLLIHLFIYSQSSFGGAYNITPSRLQDVPSSTITMMSTSDQNLHPNPSTIRGFLRSATTSILSRKRKHNAARQSSISPNSDAAWVDLGDNNASTAPSTDPSVMMSQQSTNKMEDESIQTRNREIKTNNENQVPSATFNLIKAIIGSGVLALPSGVASMSNYKFTLVPAVALIASLGAISAYTFGLYGRLLHSTQSKSLGEIWEKEKGESSAWIVSMASMTFCYGAALSYSILLGDTIPALVQASGLKGGLATSRSLWTVLLTTLVLRPLCNLKSLASLAPVSVMGVIGVIATTCFLGWRCPSVNVASPYNAAKTVGMGSEYLSTLSPELMPSFGTYSTGVLSPSSLILMGMAATAFLGHFSVAEFYQSLRKTNNGVENTVADSSVETGVNDVEKDRSLEDFFRVTIGGFGGVTIINCLVMAFGFLTFGGNSKGVILNNFSTLDPGATLCRLLMAICVIGGYPFVFSATRSEALELFQRIQPTKVSSQMEAKSRRSWSVLSGLVSGLSNVSEKSLSRFLLATLAGAALVMKNAGFVVGLNGALMGSAMIYIFPSLLFLEQTSKLKYRSSLTRRLILERLFCRFLIGFGVLAALAGGGGLVMNTYFPELL